jgi:hypothetical protein
VWFDNFNRCYRRHHVGAGNLPFDSKNWTGCAILQFFPSTDPLKQLPSFQQCKDFDSARHLGVRHLQAMPGHLMSDAHLLRVLKDTAAVDVAIHPHLGDPVPNPLEVAGAPLWVFTHVDTPSSKYQSFVRHSLVWKFCIASVPIDKQAYKVIGLTKPLNHPTSLERFWPLGFDDENPASNQELLQYLLQLLQKKRGGYPLIRADLNDLNPTAATRTVTVHNLNKQSVTPVVVDANIFNRLMPVSSPFCFHFPIRIVF